MDFSELGSQAKYVYAYKEFFALLFSLEVQYVYCNFTEQFELEGAMTECTGL